MPRRRLSRNAGRFGGLRARRGGFAQLSLTEGFGYEVDEGHCRPDSQAGMARLKPAMPPVATMARPIEATQFGQILSECGKIAQDQLYSLGTALRIGNVLRH